MARMKVYRRFMYVGIGGLGLRMGMQLEQVLRSELCGPDGRALIDADFPRPMAPYQLPRNLQFLYVDFDEADLDNVRRSSSGLAPDAVANETRQIVRGLSPRQDAYAPAAEMLRIGANETVFWLPDWEGEPQVSPLSAGAGQLPTVGRAALYETFRATGGTYPVTQPIGEAFARLAASAGDLAAISGDSAHAGYDVFVGFSAAGGTGGGICYDVIRLIAHVHAQQNGPDADLAIYPLVVMPSAFPTEHDPKTRRFHALNGGPVLKELFELVDLAHTAPSAVPAVRYPGAAEIEVTSPVPAKTAIVFDRPATLTMDDLLRSIGSFVVSIIGTTVSTDHGGEFVPLASRLVNATLQGQPAPNRIGNHPALAPLAAELRIPVEEIAEILAERLLAGATAQLLEPAAGEEDDNLRLFDRFGAASGLDALVTATAEHRLPPVSGRGAAELTEQLQKRASRALVEIRELERRLQTTLARLAHEADYGAGIETLAIHEDLFRIHRVLCGHPKFERPITRDGFRGVVARVGQEPPPNPHGFTDAPPPIASFHDRYKGFQKIAVNDEPIRQAVAVQDAWLEWAAEQVAHRVWKSYQESWRPRLHQMEDRLRDVIGVFEEHATAEPEEFRDRCLRLYRPRTGVIDFLPDGGSSNDLDPWYRSAVLPRLCEVLGLPEGTNEGRIVQRIMHGRWREGYERTMLQGSPIAARDLVLEEIRRLLKERVLTARPDERALLPTIEALLRDTAYQTPEDRSSVPLNLLPIFKRSLQQLLPMDFRPAGTENGLSGQLKVDVFYPAAQHDIAIEKFLETTALGSVQQQHRDFHPLSGVEFISVVLSRESLPATAIDEYRRLMRERAHALDHPSLGDLLPWRQRLGHDPTWLLLRRPERIDVLCAFLSAIWDGSVSVAEGDAEHPERLLVYQFDRTAGAPIDLPLRPTAGGVSRWADLLCSYERYVLGADQQALSRCSVLLERVEPSTEAPDHLYITLLSIADAEAAKAIRMDADMRSRNQTTRHALPREVEFWELLREAIEQNARRSYRWKTEPATVHVRSEIVIGDGRP
jgi:tubulin-like protein